MSSSDTDVCGMFAQHITVIVISFQIIMKTNELQRKVYPYRPFVSKLSDSSLNKYSVPQKKTGRMYEFIYSKLQKCFKLSPKSYTMVYGSHHLCSVFH